MVSIIYIEITLDTWIDVRRQLKAMVYKVTKLDYLSFRSFSIYIVHIYFST